MRKFFIIVIIVGIVVVLFTLFYRLQKPILPVLAPPTPESLSPSAEKLPFNNNDNLDQALDDMKTLDSAGIQ